MGRDPKGKTTGICYIDMAEIAFEILKILGTWSNLLGLVLGAFQ